MRPQSLACIRFDVDDVCWYSVVINLVNVAFIVSTMNTTNTPVTDSKDRRNNTENRERESDVFAEKPVVVVVGLSDWPLYVDHVDFEVPAVLGGNGKVIEDARTCLFPEFRDYCEVVRVDGENWRVAKVSNERKSYLSGDAVTSRIDTLVFYLGPSVDSDCEGKQREWLQFVLDNLPRWSNLRNVCIGGRGWMVKFTRRDASIKGRVSQFAVRALNALFGQKYKDKRNAGNPLAILQQVKEANFRKARQLVRLDMCFVTVSNDKPLIVCLPSSDEKVLAEIRHLGVWGSYDQVRVNPVFQGVTRLKLGGHFPSLASFAIDVKRLVELNLF